MLRWRKSDGSHNDASMRMPYENGYAKKTMFINDDAQNNIQPQHIYNFHNCNGVPAMFTSQYYLKLRGKHCRKPHCRNGVVDMLGQAKLPSFSFRLKTRPEIWVSNGLYLWSLNWKVWHGTADIGSILQINNFRDYTIIHRGPSWY